LNGAIGTLAARESTDWEIEKGPRNSGPFNSDQNKRYGFAPAAAALATPELAGTTPGVEL
jgi:hypothetical protein